MTNVKTIIDNLDLDTNEHDYIINCLKEAVSYCEQQFTSSGIDWLPAAACIGLHEHEKFELLKEYLSRM